jgi:small ligand-binding sensory domain FIST
VTREAAAAAGTDNIVGCSASGVIAGDHEVETGSGVAVMVLDGDVGARRFFVPFSRGQLERAADEIADAVGGSVQAHSLLLLFADSYNLEPDALFAGLARRLPGVTVVGGGASEDGSVGETAVFCGNAVSSRAVSGVLLSGNLRATVGVTHAVQRIGGLHRVTAAHGNVVLELDGRPAYEAFVGVVTPPLLDDLKRALAVMLVGLPGEDGEFVARPLLGVDTRLGALAVAAPMAEGQELFFGVRDPYGARDDLQRVLSSQATAWQDRSPAAALYVNCAGRGQGFYGVAGLDTAYIRQQLGALPVAGFFSGGEIAPTGGVTRLHQYTGVLALLGPGAEATTGGWVGNTPAGRRM